MDFTSWIERLKSDRDNAQPRANAAMMRAAQGAAGDVQRQVSMRGGSRVMVNVEATPNGAVLQMSGNRRFPVRRYAAAMNERWQAQAAAQPWEAAND